MRISYALFSLLLLLVSGYSLPSLPTKKKLIVYKIKLKLNDEDILCTLLSSAPASLRLFSYHPANN
jgi:hypothetical protein